MDGERGAERRALCVAIDEELRAFLRCVDNYQTANREVVSACKAGLFDMARARKSMGMGGCAVSQLQYPARMKASARIAVDTQSSAMQAPAPLAAAAATAAGAESETTTRSGAELKTSGTVLELVFQSYVRSEGSVRSCARTDVPEGGGDEEDEILCTDPIRWFGVFAPQDLKKSQKYFRRGLESVAAAADATVLMRLHWARYRALLADKKQRFPEPTPER